MTAMSSHSPVGQMQIDPILLKRYALVDLSRLGYVAHIYTNCVFYSTPNRVPIRYFTVTLLILKLKESCPILF